MKKVILALLIVAMISVSCFSLMACNSGVAVGFQNATNLSPTLPQRVILRQVSPFRI